MGTTASQLGKDLLSEYQVSAQKQSIRKQNDIVNRVAEVENSIVSCYARYNHGHRRGYFNALMQMKIGPGHQKYIVIYLWCVVVVSPIVTLNIIMAIYRTNVTACDHAY